MNMILLQIICLLLTLIACTGDQSEEKPLVIFGSLIPVIGYLIAFISCITIIARAFQSKGKCIFGHDLQLTYDSEAEKWKNGRMPMRVSVGGHTTYKCSCCQVEQTYTWKAF